MGWSQDELIMFLSTCLAFCMDPLSGFRFLRNTSSDCWPAHKPLTHSRLTRTRVKPRDLYCSLTTLYWSTNASDTCLLKWREFFVKTCKVFELSCFNVLLNYNFDCNNYFLNLVVKHFLYLFDNKINKKVFY